MSESGVTGVTGVTDMHSTLIILNFIQIHAPAHATNEGCYRSSSCYKKTLDLCSRKPTLERDSATADVACCTCSQLNLTGAGEFGVPSRLLTQVSCFRMTHASSAIYNVLETGWRRTSKDSPHVSLMATASRTSQPMFP